MEQRSLVGLQGKGGKKEKEDVGASPSRFGKKNGSIGKRYHGEVIAASERLSPGFVPSRLLLCRGGRASLTLCCEEQSAGCPPGNSRREKPAECILLVHLWQVFWFLGYFWRGWRG